MRDDLTRHNVEVKIQEQFKDFGTVTLEKLDVYIAACDAVVHLVGDMTGAAAKAESTKAIVEKCPDIVDKLPPLRQPLENGLDISYTQWEAWLALYHDKPLLIAKADDSAPRGPRFARTDASREAQRIHLERLRAVERHPGCTFTSPDNLAKQILSGAILDLLVRQAINPVEEAKQFHSCFISYSAKDQDFAIRLYDDLKHEGVPCWFAPHDLPIGARILDEIETAISGRDKVLLILSEQSIKSNWVEDEVKKALDEERTRVPKQTVLFPIRLDDAVMDATEAWAGLLRRDRNIGDFRRWRDDHYYRKNLERVLRDLAIQSKVETRSHSGILEVSMRPYRPLPNPGK